MIYYYFNDSRTPSIYEIINRQTNRSYIGQTVEPRNRWDGHKSSLVRKVHNLIKPSLKMVREHTVELVKIKKASINFLLRTKDKPNIWEEIRYI